MPIFGLDWLSAHLERKGYDLSAFEDEASTVVFNQETGDMVNSFIPLSKWRKDVHGGNVVIGCYAGGQYNFAQIVAREELKVTRLDLKVDLEPQEGYSANEYGTWLSRQVRNFYFKAKRHVTYNDCGTITSNPDSPKTFLFGARGSEFQMRIYSKQAQSSQVLRVEFQLRKELARQAWAFIRPNIFDQKLLAQAFAIVENTVLNRGVLHLDYEGTDERFNREPDPEPSNREMWIRTQVKSAIIKHIAETGIDLSLVLYQDVQKYFQQKMELQQAYDETSAKLALVERLLEE